MADKTHIEWTDATWNPITGCSKVSAGCKHCYAERDWARLSANPKTRYYGRAFTDVQIHQDVLTLPLCWTKPRRIFVNSMSDLFHPSVPFQFIADVFAVMSCTTRHTYQVLTKRPKRMLEFFKWLTFEEMPFFGWPDQVQATNVWPSWQPYREGKQGGYDNCGPAWPCENVWIGVSVEDQATADERIPLLLQTPAAVRWVSAEPLLGPVDLTRLPEDTCASECCGMQRLNALTGQSICDLSQETFDKNAHLDWIVVGGESGANARPMHPEWARSLRDQCAASGVPFLFKQHGEWVSDEDIDNCNLSSPEIADADQYFRRAPWPSGAESYRVGKKAAGRLLDGKLHDGYPVA